MWYTRTYIYIEKHIVATYFCALCTDSTLTYLAECHLGKVQCMLQYH